MAPNIHTLELTEAERHLKTYTQMAQVITVLLAVRIPPGYVQCRGGGWGGGRWDTHKRVPSATAQSPVLLPWEENQTHMQNPHWSPAWQTAIGGYPQIHISYLLLKKPSNVRLLGTRPLSRCRAWKLLGVVPLSQHALWQKHSGAMRGRRGGNVNGPETSTPALWGSAQVPLQGEHLCFSHSTGTGQGRVLCALTGHKGRGRSSLFWIVRHSNEGGKSPKGKYFDLGDPTCGVFLLLG